MAELRTIVHAIPVAKGRARSEGGTHHTPGRTRNFEAVAAQALRGGGRRTTPAVQFQGLVALRVVAVFPRPVKRPACVSAAAWATGGRAWGLAGADFDNVVKAIQDAGNAALIWPDDAYVAAMLPGSGKVYAAVGESPRVEVVVTDALPPVPAPMPELIVVPAVDAGAPEVL